MIYSLWTRMLRSHPWTCPPIRLLSLPCSLGRIPGSNSIDTCTRYTQAKVVTHRTTKALLRGLQDLWLTPFGPPRH
eukprot:12917417-Prorocentrum_lima.AAC.1